MASLSVNGNDSVEQDGSIRNQIILCVSMSQNIVGVVAYESEFCILKYTPEFQFDDECLSIIKIFFTLNPSLFLCSERIASAVSHNMSCIKDKSEFYVLPNRFFSSTNFTSSILSMNFPTIKHLDTTEEKEMFVRSLFPPNCNQICKSISALVQFLGDREALMDLEIFNVPLNVLDIQILNVNDVIYMDGVAMKYLQIFNPKYFGNNVLSGRQFSARVNNEISIFNFFNVCLTKLGRITLEQWMRSPLQDVERINQRLNATEFLLKTANGTLLKSIRSTLRKVENIPRIFCRMQQSSALPNDWKNLMQSLMSLEQLIGICAAHAGELYPVMQLMQEAFEIESLSIIQMWMVRIIDFEAIQKQHRFSVNQGLDSVLDEWIQTYRCLPDLLSQLAEEELKKLRENISTCALIYFPLVGFLLKIPKTEVQTPDIEFCGLQYAFADNEMAYYRNDTTRELDKRYGDVMYAIIDSETAIMHRLQDRILEHSKHILRAHQFAAEMDCLCAFAQAASSMKGVRPKLVQESLIRITNGWHPIQQLLSIDTIRNSFSSGGNHGRTTLVTGPNASGKSIYLKQIGLIIYLSQIGSFVPAEKAIIGPVDAIYVTSADDFNQGDCSAYSLSLNTASIALKHSTFKTTVLLDEFAHCINKAEAAALTVSIIEFFLRKKRPHLIASTHNMDIVENMKTQDTVKLVTMKTITHRGKIVYLYEASDGITKSSYATEAAKSAGIPTSIIKRAQTLEDLTERGSRKKLDTSKYHDVLVKLEQVDTSHMTTELFRLLRSTERVLS